MNAAQAQALCAGQLALPLLELERVLARAHSENLAVPQAARAALATLGALSVAWQANAMGHPAPLEAKQLLGLERTAIHAVRPTGDNPDA